MFLSTPEGAPASTFHDASQSANQSASPCNIPPTHPPKEPLLEPVRHMLFGTPTAIQITIKHLHKLGYAKPNDWSRPVSTGRPGEVMAILTKKVDVS